MICSKCKQDKDLHEFHPDGRYKIGYGTICEACYVAALPVILVCCRCGIKQPLEEYAQDKDSRIGRQQPCNTCRYGQRKEQALSKPTSRVARWRQSSWICNKCGIEKPVKQFTKKRDSHLGYIQPCKICRNKKQNIRRALNPEKEKARWQRYQEANGERLRLYVKAKRSQNPEKYRADKRAYRAANPAKILLEGYKRRTRKRALPLQYTDTDRQFMFQYWGYACAVCGREQGLFTHKLSNDHWIPLNSLDCPGTIPTNMIPLCSGTDGCNNSKGDDDGREWLIRRYGKHKATRILKVIKTYFDVVRQRAAEQEAAAD